MTVIYVLIGLLYIVVGCLACNYYLIKTNNKQKKHPSITKRVLFRLSIILGYPLYIIGILILYIIELLTEDEPFK